MNELKDFYDGLGLTEEKKRALKNTLKEKFPQYAGAETDRTELKNMKLTEPIIKENVSESNGPARVKSSGLKTGLAATAAAVLVLAGIGAAVKNYNGISPSGPAAGTEDRMSEEDIFYREQAKSLYNLAAETLADIYTNSMIYSGGEVTREMVNNAEPLDYKYMSYKNYNGINEDEFAGMLRYKLDREGDIQGVSDYRLSFKAREKSDIGYDQFDFYATVYSESGAAYTYPPTADIEPNSSEDMLIKAHKLYEIACDLYNGEIALGDQVPAVAVDSNRLETVLAKSDQADAFDGTETFTINLYNNADFDLEHTLFEIRFTDSDGDRIADGVESAWVYSDESRQNYEVFPTQTTTADGKENDEPDIYTKAQMLYSLACDNLATTTVMHDVPAGATITRDLLLQTLEKVENAEELNPLEAFADDLYVATDFDLANTEFEVYFIDTDSDGNADLVDSAWVYSGSDFAFYPQDTVIKNTDSLSAYELYELAQEAFTNITQGIDFVSPETVYSADIIDKAEGRLYGQSSITVGQPNVYKPYDFSAVMLSLAKDRGQEQQFINSDFEIHFNESDMMIDFELAADSVWYVYDINTDTFYPPVFENSPDDPVPPPV